MSPNKNLSATVLKAVVLAPSSQAYGTHASTFVGVDEGLNSKLVWNSLKTLVAANIVGAAGPLWHETYRKRGGGVIGLSADDDYRQWLRRQRQDRSLMKLSCTDNAVATMAISHLYLYRTVFVLSADRGSKPDALRSELDRATQPLRVASNTCLGMVLILKKGSTHLGTFALNARAIICAAPYRIGYEVYEV